MINNFKYIFILLHKGIIFKRLIFILKNVFTFICCNNKDFISHSIGLEYINHLFFDKLIEFHLNILLLLLTKLSIHNK